MRGRRPRTPSTIKDPWSRTLATIPAATATPGWPPGSRPPPPCCPRSWVAPRPSRWRSDGPPGSSNPPNGPPWPSATAAVSSPTANGPWPGATPTTCATGSMAAPPTWPTWPCCAAPTTGPCTRAAGGYNAVPTAASPPPHPTAGPTGEIPAPPDPTGRSGRSSRSSTTVQDRAPHAARDGPDVGDRCTPLGAYPAGALTRPGAAPIPRGRFSATARPPDRPSADLGHHLVGDVEVGVDVLDVVEVFQGVEEAEDPEGHVAVEGDRHAGDHGDLGGVVGDAGGVEGGADGAEVAGGGGDGEALLAGLDVFGAGFEGDLHDAVLVGPVAQDDQQAAPVEEVGDAAGVGQAAATLGDHVADVGGGPVAVVGQGLDHYRHPAGGVRLVGGQLQALAAELAGAPLGGPVDGVVGHRVVLGLLDGVGQGRVALGVAAALAGRDLDRPDQLGEQLAPPGVLGALLVLDRRPLRVPAHDGPLSATRSSSQRCRRTSPDSSGWKAVASRLPWRTATTLPSTSASTSTSRARKIMPAQVPSTGRPAATRSRSGPSSP